jgi:phosphoglycolate phosphatase
MEFKALLLDLDGTLVNTAPDMVGSLNRLLERHGRSPVDIAQASKLVSNGARALVGHGFGTEIDGAQTSALIQEFLDIYQQQVCNDSYLYAGMPETLELCEAHQVKWGIITNKPLHLAKQLIEGLGLLERCAILLGGDSLPVKKPDPVPLLHSSMVLNLAPSQCIYVGDHERDIRAGNAAGMDTAAALWGYIANNDDPNNWNARYLVSKPEGLMSLVREKLTKA